MNSQQISSYASKDHRSVDISLPLGNIFRHDRKTSWTVFPSFLCSKSRNVPFSSFLKRQTYIFPRVWDYVKSCSVPDSELQKAQSHFLVRCEEALKLLIESDLTALKRIDNTSRSYCASSEHLWIEIFFIWYNIHISFIYLVVHKTRSEDSRTWPITTLICFKTKNVVRWGLWVVGDGSKVYWKKRA